MEVVEENPEEARARECIVEPGPAKKHDADGKTLGDEPKSSGLAENAQQNGARVSENGEQGFSGDLGGGSDEKGKGNVNETETEISSGYGVGVEDVDDSGALEDSEMNGVSSLLKMKQDFGEKENASSSDAGDVGKDIDVQEEEAEIDGEEEEEEEHRFRVGDFVWGKIKSHPWWPGQIYDSSDASDLALKIKQKGRLLVAYFGDGTFAWCHPSQLKPFVENFKEFSRICSSRGFVNAVEEAVEEMGRHVEYMVTYACAGKEHLDDGLSRPAAVNAGIKEGVLVPEIRREIISGLEFEPEEILRSVKALAETVPLSDLLEFEVLRRKISAFYRAKGKYGLTEYHEPRPVPGLEDKNVERAVKLRGSKGSSVEDGLNAEESDRRSLDKCSGFPEHRLHHKRKQKSIAEILETAKIEEEVAHRDASTSRKKRKGTDEVKSLTTATSTPRRRSVSELSTVEATGPEQKEENSKEKTLFRKRKKRSSDVEDGGSGKREETTLVEEKNQKKTSGSENDFDSTPLASLRKRIKIDVSSIGKDSGNGESKAQTPNDSLSRERRKSKYLSPPYTTEFSWKAKRSEGEAESMKVSSQARVGERMTNAAENLIVTANEEIMPSDKPADDDSGRQELTNELRMAADFLRLGAPTNELKDLILAAALSPQYAEDDSSNDLIREFVSIYRSFVYHDGANRKMNVKEKEQSREEQNEAGKPKKKKERKPEKMRKAKQNIAETEKQVSPSVVLKRPENASPNERRKKKRPENASAPGKCPETEPENASTEIEYVKEKLEQMRSMLETSGGRMTEELKTKLEDEMRNLLEKVSKMAVLST